MAYTFLSGATGGIGKAFAYAVAARGGDLFITGRNEEKLSLLEKEIKEEFPDIKTSYYACDLTDENSRSQMLSFIDSEGITFERILNVAGVDTQMAFADYTEEKVLFQLRVNAEATIALTHALLKRRAENSEELELLCISSMSGVSPMPYFALYSATKALLTNFFTSLHYELKGEGVKVTVVLPGGVYTRPDIVEDIKGQGLWGKLSAKSPEYVAERSLNALKKNKLQYIPGAFNKFLYFVMKLAPKRIKLRFIARRWKKIKKDAF